MKDDFVDRLTNASVEARSVLHELYGAMKEARKLVKELETTIDKMVVEKVDDKIDHRVKVYMDSLGEKTREAMDAATEKVNREFTKLTNIMMYGTENPRNTAHLESIADIAKRTRIVKGNK